MDPALRAAIAAHPIVILTGARQVGKSTLLLKSEPFAGWRYHTLDDFNVARQVREDPVALWAGARNVVLDEVQKAPTLLSAVKQAVDRAPDRMRFVLSGSANLLLMRQVSESLAGRAVYHVLAPMTRGEINLASPPTLLADALAGKLPEETTLAEALPDPALLLLRGLMPGLLIFDDPSAWLRWWEGYVATYLERDLRQISKIDALVDFRRVMELLALRTGQIMNQSDIARDAQLSQATVHRYLNLLETTYLFQRLPAYSRGRTSRLVKSPKAYWVDAGLAAYLCGYFDADSLRTAREFGALFEAFVFHHLLVLARLLVPSARLYYWRTRAGAEVDFIVEHGRRVVGIEVKLTSRPTYGDLEGLRAFLQEYPHASAGLLLHAGREIRRMGERIIALPWTAMTG
ncbi:MAG: ATP-binding protein [Anaerolineales bacterium]